MCALAFDCVRRAALAVAVFLPALLATHVAADDPTSFRPTPASVRPQEQKRSTDDFRRDGAGTPVYEFLFLLGCVEALSLGRTRDAIRDCSEAIVLNPKSPAGYKLRGMANFGEGNFGPALGDLNIAAALDPNDAEIESARGAVFRAQGETDSALQSYSRAIAIQPMDSRWWNARCWTRAIVGEQLLLALADCNKAVSLDPGYAMAYDSRGLVYLQLGRYSRAIRDYDRALALRQMASSFFGRGAAKLKHGDKSGHWDIARARAGDPNIDTIFRRYGIVVDTRSGRPPVKPPCEDLCPPIRPLPKPRLPTPPNGAQPARSASIDLDHGKRATGR
jgi:lipoprotein NlpI